MFRVTSPRRELYGLCLGVLLLANLAGSAAVVVARATGPGTAPAASGTTPAAADPTAGLADRPAAMPAATASDSSATDSGPSDCGQGSATAQAVLDRTAGGYVLRATVANDSNRTVELDRLVVRAVYADGARTFTAAATGHQISSGVAATGHQISSGVAATDFALPDSTSASPPVSFAVTDFAFHTAGRPGCAAR